MTATLPAGGSQDVYETLARFYDAFTVHHRYELWTEMLERLLRPHGLRDRGRLLDVGCGTGKSFQPWEARGWSVVGCDVSSAMLASAAAKAGAGTTTLVADARELPDLGAFDLVAMTDDVVNCLAPGERHGAFAGVKRNLAADGLFVFDVNTLLTYRTFFAATDVRDTEDCFIVFRGETSPRLAAGGTAEANFDAFVAGPDGRYERLRVHDRQHHHPIDQLTTDLAAAGLRVCSVHGTDEDCRTAALDELRHVKAIVVAAHAER